MLPNLYALRFLLAFFVLIGHVSAYSEAMDVPFYHALPLFGKGTLAVYYFFTLSGFLIIRLIYLEIIKTGDFNFKDFYIRRIQRLYPVYYLVLFTGIIFYHVLLPVIGVDKTMPYDVATLLLYYVFFIPNIFIHYYDTGNILLVLWSIGVEEQFYLFIPLILYLGKKKIVLTLFLTLILSVVVAFVYFDFYKYDSYFFYFLFGGFCAVISEKYKLNILYNKVVHLLVYGCFFSSFILLDNKVLNHGFNVVLSGVLITLLAYYPMFKIKSRFFNYLGKISYGLYMYHMIVITGLLFLAKQFNLSELVSNTVFIVSLNVATVMLSIIVSSLSYEYFEKLFYKPKLLRNYTNYNLKQAQ